MSFGFGVGDCLAILKLVIEARKRLVDAPSQFNDISNELRNFLIVVHDIDVFLSGCELQAEQRAGFASIMGDSRRLLTELNGKVDRYRGIGVPSTSATQRLKKTWKRLRMEPGDIQEIRAQISSNTVQLNTFRGTVSSQTTASTNKKVDCLIERSDQQERLEILKWIGTVDHGSQQREAADRHEQGTGQWLLDSDECQRWINTKGEVLFCPGLPGAGKTVLTSVVIDHLLERFSDRNATGIAYHYCHFKRQDKEDASIILSSILKQLVQGRGDIPDSLSLLYKKHKEQSTKPSFDEICSTLQSVAPLHSRVFIFIDGLDECLESDGTRGRLLTQLFHLQNIHGANIFATSRFIPDITKRLEGSSVVEVLARDTDVRKYLVHEMPRLGDFVMRDPKLQDEICSRILQSMGGMFLLAHLHFESLIGNMSTRTLKKALKGLATGSSAYEQTYMAAMERIERQRTGQVEVAKTILAWITLAKRPLQVEELREAIAVKDGDLEFEEDGLPDIDDMISVCAGLVTVDMESGTIGLIHYTTQEYLEGTRATWFPNAEAEIATSCLTYLLFPTSDVEFLEMDDDPVDGIGERQGLQAPRFFETGKVSVGGRGGKRHAYRDSLFHYAKIYGVLHARLATPEPDVVARFFSSPSKMPGNCLLLAAKYGDEKDDSMAHWLLKRGADVNVCDATRKTPLHYAVIKGWERCVRLLLQRGARLTLDIDDMSPFLYAVDQCAEEIAEAFLSAGIPIDTQVKKEIWIPSYRQGRVVYARENGAQEVEESCTGKGLTALHLATLTGNPQMIMFLLDRGANPNFPSDCDETPLHLALRRDFFDTEWPGHVDFWKHPNHRIGVFYERVGDIVRRGIVRLLLKHPSIDVNARDVRGISPLHIAAREKNYSESLFQKLFEKNAKVSARTEKNETPLHFASQDGNMSAVTALLEKGASPMDVDANGLNSLHYAAQTGKREVMQNLINHVPDNSFDTFLKSKDKQGQNALHHLFGNCGFAHTAAVEFLLRWPDSINDLDNEGMSPMAKYLSTAIHVRRDDDSTALRLMFESGADPCFETREGLGLAHLAVGSPRASVSLLKTLASWGVDVTAKDKHRRTVLHYTAIKGTLTEEILHHLCSEMGLSAGLRDAHGKTPLEYAVEMGQRVSILFNS